MAIKPGILRDNTSHDVRSRTLLLALVVWVLCGLAGCRDEQPAAVVDAGVSAPVPVQPGPLAALQLPADVLACGGDDAPAALLREADAGASAPGLLLGLMRQRYGLTETGFIARERPLRFALIDSEQRPALVLMVAVTDPDAARRALPADRAKAPIEDGYLLLSDVELTEQHITFMRQLRVAELPASQAALLSLHRARQLLLAPTAGVSSSAATTAAPSAPGASGAASAGAPSALDASSAVPAGAASASASSASATPPPGEARDVVPSAESLDGLALLRRALRGLDDIDRVMLTSKASEGRSIWTARLHPVADSALAKALVQLKPRPLQLLAKAPPDAAALVAVSLDPAGPKLWLDSLSAWMVQVSLPEAQAGPGYQQAHQALRAAASGELLLLLHQSKAGTQRSYTAVSSLFGLKKDAETEAVLSKIHGVQGDAAVKALYDRLGMEVRARRAPYRVGEVPIDVVSAKLRVDPRRPAAPPSAASDVLMQLLTVHTAVQDQLLIRTYGGQARPVMAAWLGGEIEGGAAQRQDVRQALARGVQQPLLFAHVQPRRSWAWARQLGSLKGNTDTPRKRSPSDKAAANETSEVLSLSAGTADGELLLTLDLPSTPLRTLSTLLQALSR